MAKKRIIKTEKTNPLLKEYFEERDRFYSLSLEKQEQYELLYHMKQTHNLTYANLMLNLSKQI